MTFAFSFENRDCFLGYRDYLHRGFLETKKNHKQNLSAKAQLLFEPLFVHRTAQGLCQEADPWAPEPSSENETWEAGQVAGRAGNHRVGKRAPSQHLWRRQRRKKQWQQESPWLKSCRQSTEFAMHLLAQLSIPQRLQRTAVSSLQSTWLQSRAPSAMSLTSQKHVLANRGHSTWPEEHRGEEKLLALIKNFLEIWSIFLSPLPFT